MRSPFSSSAELCSGRFVGKMHFTLPRASAPRPVALPVGPSRAAVSGAPCRPCASRAAVVILCKHQNERKHAARKTLRIFFHTYVSSWAPERTASLVRRIHSHVTTAALAAPVRPQHGLTVSNDGSVSMMRHRCKKAELGLPADQRKALVRSLVTEVLRHGRITTTKVCTLTEILFSMFTAAAT